MPQKRNKTVKSMRRKISQDQEAPENPNLSKDREILIKKNRVMAAGHYSVEISRVPKAMLISAVRLENPAENYLIELEKQKANVIIKEFNEDLKTVVANLQILNRRLVLLNPQISKKPKKRRIFRKKASKTSRKKERNEKNELLLADEQPRRLEASEIKEERDDESPRGRKPETPD